MTMCRRCGQAIVFALVTNKEGRPPSRMPLNPTPDPAGNVAVNRDVTGGLTGHVLSKGQQALGYQRLYLPHAASCRPVADAQPPPGVAFLDQYRAAKSAQAKDGRRRRGKRRTTIQDYLGYRKP